MFPQTCATLCWWSQMSFSSYMLWACCCSYILACLENNNRNSANSTELLSGSLSLPALLYQPTVLPEWKVTSGALFCRQGQRSALRSLYLGVLRKRKCQRGQWPCGSFLQGFLLRSALWFIFFSFPSAPLPAPVCPTVVHVLLLRSLCSFLSSPLHIICPFPFSPPPITEMHASFPILREESINSNSYTSMG